MIQMKEVTTKAWSYSVGNRAATELREAAEQRVALERELYRVNRKLELQTKLDSLTALQKELLRHEPWFVGRERHWLAKSACAKTFKTALAADAEEVTVEEIEDMMAWCVAAIFSAEQFLRPLRPLKEEQDRIEEERRQIQRELAAQQEKERQEAERRRAAELAQHMEFVLQLKAEGKCRDITIPRAVVEMTEDDLGAAGYEDRIRKEMRDHIEQRRLERQAKGQKDYVPRLPRFPPRHRDPNWWRKRYTINRDHHEYYSKLREQWADNMLWYVRPWWR